MWDVAQRALDQMLHYFSAAELFNVPPNDARFRQEVERLPTDWLMRTASHLNWLLEHPDAAPPDLHAFAIDAFAPGTVRPRLQEVRAARGDLFLYEDQLLGLMRAAVLYGSDAEPEIIDEAGRSAFFWSLLRYGDLRSREMGEPTDEETAAAVALRGLGVGQSAPHGNVLARAYALWLDLPQRPEVAASPFAMDLAGEFAHATASCTLAEYLTVVMAAAAHARDVGPLPLAQALPRWPMDATGRFASSRHADRLAAALATLSADRAEMRRLFEQEMPPDPQYLGAAMLPFRDRPLYRLRGGRYVVTSESLLLEGVYELAYWRVAEHLRVGHGSAAEFLRFTQFYATMFERYVIELLRSVYDRDRKRVYSEVEALPPQGAPDAAIFLDDRVLMVEVTKTQLRYFETVLAGNLANFDADVARTAAKVRQLRDAAQAFGEGRIRYDGHDSAAERTKPVERLVVMSQAIPRFPFLTDRLRRALDAAGVEQDAWIISVAELESLLLDGDLGRVSRLLREWTADVGMRDTSFHNFLFFRRAIAPVDQRAPYLRANAEALRRRIIAEMDFVPE